ncbi:MAG: hypothetical protein AAB510_03320 [Patescibacteria group bacterium]
MAGEKKLLQTKRTSNDYERSPIIDVDESGEPVESKEANTVHSGTMQRIPETAEVSTVEQPKSIDQSKQDKNKKVPYKADDPIESSYAYVLELNKLSPTTKRVIAEAKERYIKIISGDLQDQEVSKIEASRRIKILSKNPIEYFKIEGKKIWKKWKENGKTDQHMKGLSDIYIEIIEELEAAQRHIYITKPKEKAPTQEIKLLNPTPDEIQARTEKMEAATSAPTEVLTETTPITPEFNYEKYKVPTTGIESVDQMINDEFEILINRAKIAEDEDLNNQTNLENLYHTRTDLILLTSKPIEYFKTKEYNARALLYGVYESSRRNGNSDEDLTNDPTANEILQEINRLLNIQQALTEKDSEKLKTPASTQVASGKTDLEEDVEFKKKYTKDIGIRQGKPTDYGTNVTYGFYNPAPQRRTGENEIKEKKAATQIDPRIARLELLRKQQKEDAEEEEMRQAILAKITAIERRMAKRKENKLLEQEPKIKTFSIVEIKQEIENLLKKNLNIKSVREINLENKDGNSLSLNTEIVTTTGSMKVGINIILENIGDEIGVRSFDQKNIRANMIVRSLIIEKMEPKIREIGKILREYVEKNDGKNRKVNKMYIENGNLVVEFK